MLPRKRNPLLNSRREVKPVVRVVEHRMPERRAIIAVDYMTAEGVFLIKRNDVHIQRVFRNGRTNEEFAEEVVAGYRDIIVVTALLRSKDADREIAEKQCEGVLNSARLKLKKLFESMEQKR